MSAKLFTLLSLALAPTSMIVMISNSLVVQAQGCPDYLSAWICEHLNDIGVRVNSIKPGDWILKLEEKIRKNEAKADDYILVGYLYAKVGNTLMSETRLTEGLNLAKKDRNLHGQAIAARALGEVFVTTDKKQEAISRLTEARNVYIKLGDRQGVMEINQQLIRLSNPQILKNPSQQIPGPINLPSDRLLNR
jgi:hypothetical protein